MKATIDKMIVRKWGRIVNITSNTVKTPSDELCLSKGARTGLSGFVAGQARQVARHGVTTNNILPGNFDTDCLFSNFIAASESSGVAIEQIRNIRMNQNPARGFGDLVEFGAACGFLCRVHAGYIDAPKILLDGGAYPATM